MPSWILTFIDIGDGRRVQWWIDVCYKFDGEATARTKVVMLQQPLLACGSLRIASPIQQR